MSSWGTQAAIVTGCGSAQGIGMACARALGEQGVSLVITATGEHIFERAAELTAEGITAIGVVADLRDPEHVDCLHQVCVTEFGAPSILVNNAGMTERGAVVGSGSIDEVSLDEWRAGLQRNLDTAFLMSRAVVPGMREQGYGRIINIASVTGPIVAMRKEAAYAAAKAGMLGLTRAVAIDEAAHGITVNAVAPGWIATAVLAGPEALQGLATPMGRSGTPEEIAGAVAWLASPTAGYITGQIIVIDGGNSIAEERATS